MAAQQRMTEAEVKRRQVTGTLASGSVTAAIAALGLSDENLIGGKTSTAPSGNKMLRLDDSVCDLLQQNPNKVAKNFKEIWHNKLVTNQ